MKKISTIIAILICQITLAQITHEDISSLKGLPKTYQYQLDIIQQKLKNETFKNTEHNRFEVDIVNNKIVHQTMYDTINNKYPNNKYIEYQYVDDYQKHIYTNFKGELLKTIRFDYNDKGKLQYQTTFDQDQDKIITITHYYEKCKPNYIADLIEGIDLETIETTFKCEAITNVKEVSKYTRTQVNVYKTGIGKVKEINLKGDKDAMISSIFSFKYDENGNIIKVNYHFDDKAGVYKTSKYNEFGDIINLKQGIAELYYSYKYDKNNNWIEKIETSKIKHKRYVYKRTFTY